MEWSIRHVYDHGVTLKHKRPLLPTIGFGVLMLQAMTSPFAFATALRPASDQPAWMTGTFLAADLAAAASLALIAFGRRTHQASARFAPLVLVAPAWVAIALLSPLQYDTLSASAMYSVYALVVAALSSIPFLTRDGVALFEAQPIAASQAAPAFTAEPIA
jgi:hypothetical protein